MLDRLMNWMAKAPMGLVLFLMFFAFMLVLAVIVAG